MSMLASRSCRWRWRYAARSALGRGLPARSLASSPPAAPRSSEAAGGAREQQQIGSFRALARSFAAVEEAKSSRDASVGLLAQSFRELLALPTANDLACALSLTSSQLAPAYEGIELRFGAKSFARFLHQLETDSDSGAHVDSLEKLLTAYPDYGQATQALLDSGRISVPVEAQDECQPLSIAYVHEQLLAMAQNEGAGGLARKQQLALQLLQQCSCAEERIFLVRMLAHQSLRIGMGEKSILSALALASFPTTPEASKNEDGSELAAATSSARKKDWVDCVTLAYAQHPNYSVLAELLHANRQEQDVHRKIRWLQNEARPTAGVPVLTMSAYPVSSVSAVLERVAKSESRTATCEYKYDGARVQIHLGLSSQRTDNATRVGRIFSRNMEDNTAKYESLLDVLQRQISVRNANRHDPMTHVSSLILEGEVVALDRSTGVFRPFQVLQTKTTTEFCLFAFDLLAMNGQNLLQKSLRTRREMLRDLFVEDPGYVELVQHIDLELATDETGVDAGVDADADADADGSQMEEMAVVRSFLDQSVAGGCEGLMVKTLDSASEYKAGRRSYSWMKLKHDYLSDAPTSSSSSRRKSTVTKSSENGTFLADTLDLVPIGAFYGKGRRTGVFGSFLMAAYNSSTGKFETIGKVGTGFSDALLTEVTTRLRAQELPATDQVPEQYQSQAIRSRHPDVWLSPSEVWEIKATQLTESPSYTCGADTPAEPSDEAVDSSSSASTPQKGLALRFPRFLRVRQDKDPLQATEREQVLELFQQQQQQRS